MLDIRIRRRGSVPRRCDAAVLKEGALRLFPARCHFAAVYSAFGALPFGDGRVALFGPGIESYFPPEDLEVCFIRYQGHPAVHIRRELLPVPDFKPDFLLSSVELPDDPGYVLLDEGPDGGLAVTCLPKRFHQPLGELLTFALPETVEAEPLRHRELSRAYLGFGPVRASAVSAAGVREGPRPKRPVSPPPAAGKNLPPSPVRLPEPVDPLEAKPLPAALSRGPLPGGTAAEIAALAEDDPGAWFALFLKFAGLSMDGEGRVRSWIETNALQEQELPSTRLEALRADAQICLLNALWKDRSLLDRLRGDTALRAWVKRFGPQVAFLLQEETGREDPPVRLNLKARWSHVFFSTRARFDYFWAFGKRDELLRDLEEDGLAFGTDLPKFIEELPVDDLVKVFGLTERSLVGQMKAVTGRIDALGGDPADDRQPADFRDGSLKEDERPARDPYDRPRLEDYLDSDPLDDGIYDDFVDALKRVFTFAGGERADPALAERYFRFLGRVIDAFGTSDKIRRYAPIRLVRHELRHNLVRFAADKRFRDPARAILSVIRTVFIPRIVNQRELFFARIVQIALERAVYEATGDLGAFLAFIEVLTESQQEQLGNEVDRRDVLMEVLCQMLHFSPNEKMGIVSRILGRLERLERQALFPTPRLLGEVKTNLKHFLRTFSMKQEDFRFTCRRWEKWRLQKVVEEELAAIRLREFTLRV